MLNLRWTSFGILIVPIILNSFACAGDTAPTADGWAADSAAVLVAESHEPLLGPLEVWKVGPEARLDIGLNGGDEAYLFHRIQDALRLPSGDIVVADGGSSQLRFFNASGQHVRTIGGQGSGPGEFRTFAGIDYRQDTLFVFDALEGRVSVFDTAGAFVRSFPLEPQQPPRRYRLAGVIGDTMLLFVASFDFPPVIRSPEPRMQWVTQPNLLYDRNGKYVATVGDPAGMDLSVTPEMVRDVGFGRTSSVAAYGGHIFVTDGGQFSVQVYDAHGTLRRIVRLPRDRREVTSHDVEQMTEARLARVGDDPTRRAAARRSLATRSLATYKPWISMVLVDDLGHLWVKEYQADWVEQSSRWQVFDQQGRWLGLVRMPRNLQVMQIGQDFVLAGWRDGFGVEHIGTHSLVKPQS